MSDISGLPVEDQHCAGPLLYSLNSFKFTLVLTTVAFPEAVETCLTYQEVSWVFSHRSGCLAGRQSTGEQRHRHWAVEELPSAGAEEGRAGRGAARKASSCSFKGEMLPLLILIRQSPKEGSSGARQSNCPADLSSPGSGHTQHMTSPEPSHRTFETSWDIMSPTCCPLYPV